MRSIGINSESYSGDYVRVLPTAGLAPRRELRTPISIVPANKLIKQLPAALLKKLGPHIKTTNFTSGEFVHRPDEDMEWICFPETAVVSELQILEDGRTIEVAVTGFEGAVGLLSVYCPGRSNNWAQVSAPGTAIRINRDALRKETHDLDLINSVFYSSVQEHIRQISQKVACNAHHSVEERFSTWLLMVQERCGSSRLKLTQEHMARVLGVYRPSVTCIAQRMRDAGLIDYIRGYIVIHDKEGLKERACGCYRELSLVSPGIARREPVAPM
jgi:CRP-like cAMP-binding protein